MSKTNWSFAQVWNKSLEQTDKRKYEPREHIWASELGKSYVDRWYKMKGTEPTNPANPRTLRKFEAGNVFEWIVEMVLARSGLLIDKQEWVEFQYPGLPRVTGKLDHMAGGAPDWEEVERGFADGNLPDFMKNVARSTIEYFKKEYPEGLKPIVLEVKSVGSMLFGRYKDGIANPTHELQLFHYLKAKNMPEGHIVYISKDDLMLVEIGVFNSSKMEDRYREDIKTMGKLLASDTPPKPEDEIIWDEDSKKFRLNWMVSYSPYLTLVYGYKNQAEFEDKYKGKTARWNRVVGRILKGDVMTDNNLGAISEIKELFPDFEERIKRTDSNEIEGVSK